MSNDPPHRSCRRGMPLHRSHSHPFPAPRLRPALEIQDESVGNPCGATCVITAAKSVGPIGLSSRLRSLPAATRARYCIPSRLDRSRCRHSPPLREAHERISLLGVVDEFQLRRKWRGGYIRTVGLRALSQSFLAVSTSDDCARPGVVYWNGTACRPVDRQRTPHCTDVRFSSFSPSIGSMS